MKLASYPEYKTTEVSWLGKIPAEWDVKPLRALLFQRNEKNNPIKTTQILSLSIAHGVTLYSHEGRGGNKSKEDLTAYKVAYPGDIILNSMNVIVGAVGLSKYKGAISPVYYALHSRSDNECILYYNKIFSNSAFQNYLSIYGKGILIKKSDSGKLNTIRMKISPGDLKKISLPVPSKKEQIQISMFLDWKISQINKFIYNKRQLIALLKEQKKNIINEAVTKGIDFHVKMKDSGIAWLGSIPEHWRITKIKYISCMKSGDNITSVDIDRSGNYPVYGGNGLRGYYYDYNREGNFLLVGRQGALCGNVHHIKGKFWATDHAVVTSVRTGVSVTWCYYMLLVMNFNQYSESAAQPGISVEKIKNLQTALPSLQEQQLIVFHI